MSIWGNMKGGQQTPHPQGPVTILAQCGLRPAGTDLWQDGLVAVAFQLDLPSVGGPVFLSTYGRMHAHEWTARQANLSKSEGEAIDKYEYTIKAFLQVHQWKTANVTLNDTNGQLGNQLIDWTVDWFIEHHTGKANKPASAQPVIRSLAALGYPKGKPQWVGMVMEYPGMPNGYYGLVTTGGVWVQHGNLLDCIKGYNAQRQNEIVQQKWVQLPDDGPLANTCRELLKGRIKVMHKNGVPAWHSTGTPLVLEAKPVDLMTNAADWEKAWKLTAGIASSNIITSASALPSSFTMDALGPEQTQPPPVIIKPRVVPDVDCSACDHRLTSHIQNETAADPGSCVMSGCRCEQWRRVCQECRQTSYPWGLRHGPSCKTGAFERAAVASQEQAEDDRKVNRRMRGTLGIPEDADDW